MSSIFIAERLLTGDSSATMALPDWQSGENAKNYTEFFCYHLAKAHIQRTQAKASFYYRQSVLSSPNAYLTLAHHRKRTSKALRMLFAQILTYRTPKCNAPIQWNWILWLEKPKPSQQLRLLSTEADRSRQKHKKHRFSDAFCVSLTSNSQRSFSNKIN